MTKRPVIILATSNGVGMGHLARASAIARVLKEQAEVIVVSMAGAVSELPRAMNVPVEYIPGRDRNLMSRLRWDRYLKDRLVALIDETGASLLAFDGVVPYPGVIAAKEARPRVKLVWMRRGLWQWKPSSHLLTLQSKLMDHIVEPGDFARAFDTGPTVMRKDAHLTSPISLYHPSWALPREEAQRILKLDPKRPAVLVQLGTGERDVNEKMHAALCGLLGWKNLQVVLTKHPIDYNGQSLAPDGLDLRVIRYFPLADLLHAFDAAIAAAGYNGVHELLPARLPTVFIPNIRGTDDQASRARWSSEQGFSLLADHESLNDITSKVQLLQDAKTRERLSRACAELPNLNGNLESADYYLKILGQPEGTTAFRLNYLRYWLRTQSSRQARALAVSLLRGLAILYRTFFPREDQVTPSNPEVIFTDTTDAKTLSELIKSPIALEHLLKDSSSRYRGIRREIASRAYRMDFVEEKIVEVSMVTQVIEESL